MSVTDRLAELARDTGAEERRETGVTEYSRDGVVFAAETDETVELRLSAEIADAARRTPDTHVSARGEGWVRFAPREWDSHATDRLEAWFRVAWRAAADRGG